MLIEEATISRENSIMRGTIRLGGLYACFNGPRLMLT